MHIVVPKEIKNHEYRVGLLPQSVRRLVDLGHQVSVQQHAGAALGYTDDCYRAAGADIVSSPETLWQAGDLVVKVKEPQPDEYPYLKRGKMLFCYLHLAAEPALTEILLQRQVSAFAFETIIDQEGQLPVLKPMSILAGRLAVQVGSHFLTLPAGGRGILLAGAPGVPKGHVVIIGAGVVGTHALEIAVGMGASVTILDSRVEALAAVEARYGHRVNTLASEAQTITEQLALADLVVGSVLVPGESAPKVVSRAMLQNMKPGSVMVDVAIDQGGCFESSRLTSHEQPTYSEQSIVHYCVPNMPSLAAKTATHALNNALWPYLAKLVTTKDVASLTRQYAELFSGLNVFKGNIIHSGLASSLGCKAATIL